MILIKTKARRIRAILQTKISAPFHNSTQYSRLFQKSHKYMEISLISLILARF